MKAVLFDLDGTLLDCDINEQLQSYFSRITVYAKEHMPSIYGTLTKDIYTVVSELISDEDPKKTVEQKYWEKYTKRTGAVKNEMVSAFTKFYQTEYSKIGEHYKPVPEMQQAVKYLKNKGYPLCVATNCFYPIEAVEWRLKWAGFELNDFDAVTHYANMHFTKPNLQYFLEAAALLKAQPEHCLMVGNDGADDMVAGQLNMQTYLVTDNLLNENGYTGQRGSYKDFLKWLQDCV